jgi:DNA topoisomerase-1
MTNPKFYKKKFTSTSSKKTETLDTSQFFSAKYLIIVESPSKCGKIEGFLGSQYKCIASKGHLREIDGLKSINSKGNYEITFSVIKEKASHIEYMRKIISMFSPQNVFLATDDDREGEAIAWHICDIFELDVHTTPRILFHEITKPAILHAVVNPTKLNIKLVEAQKARQVLDMLVGYKISPLLWKHIYMSKDSSLSAGRCQTPALRLIYDNEKEKGSAENIETKYKTMARFFSKNLEFCLNNDMKTKDEVISFMEKSKTYSYSMKLNSPKESFKSPPKPFNTSKLLQTASNLLHLSPKQTMSYCQQLYQDGHITYMRTDSTKYSKEFLEKVKQYVSGKWKSDFLGDLSKIENNNSADPHEAIRVTHIEQSSISSEDPRLRNLYNLIWRTTVESCMKDAKYKVVDAIITSPIPTANYVYTVEMPLFLGWKIVSQNNKEDCDLGTLQNNANGIIMYLESMVNSQTKIKHNEIQSIVSIQNRHSHYTEASLIQKLEDLGIGRPSTFSMLVETIQDRGYVKRMDIEGEKIKCVDIFLSKDGVIKKEEKEKVFGAEKNKLVIQPTGILCLEFLLEHFDNIFSYNYTKLMEDELDIISNEESQTKWYELCKKCNDELKIAIKPVSKLEKQTYSLMDSEYVVVFQQHGPTMRRVMDDGQIEYKAVRKDIQLDMDKLRGGEYLFDELIEIKNDVLGEYKGETVYLRNGKYGPYIQWGEVRESIKTLKKSLIDVTYEDVLPYILRKMGEYGASPSGLGSGGFLPEGGSGNGTEEVRVLPPPPPPGKNVLRIISSDLSIRRGKFGAYIFYQSLDMNKPEFYSLAKFKGGFAKCPLSELTGWIKETYNIPR